MQRVQDLRNEWSKREAAYLFCKQEQRERSSQYGSRFGRRRNTLRRSQDEAAAFRPAVDAFGGSCTTENSSTCVLGYALLAEASTEAEPEHPNTI